MRRTATAMTIALAALAALPAAAQEGGPPPPRVRLAAVELREVAPILLAPATVASRRDARLAAETAGRLTFVAEPGDAVAEGEAVARIDEAEASLRVREAEARAAGLEVSLRQLSRDVTRSRGLAERGTLPESQLEELEARRDITAQDLAEARLAVERAQVELARATLLAPFDGVVVERISEAGEYAAPGREIARFLDVTSLEARVQAPVSVARYVAVGDVLRVSDEDEALHAPIRVIVPAGDPSTRTFELRVDLEGADWIVGAPVRVAVPTAEPRESVCAPRDALVLRENGAYVMRVDAENVAHRIDVTPGAGDGEWIAVGDALEPGDLVVVRGAERLRDGQTVEPLAEAETAANAGGGAQRS